MENSKRIGIVTWFHWINYGTVLQACALNQYLNKLHYNAETVNLIPDYTVAEFRLKKKVKQIIKKLINKRKCSITANITEFYSETKELRFKDFRNKYIRFSDKIEEKDFPKLIKKYDKVVYGSDQIWSPLFFKKIYWGKYVKRSKLVAYAPSAGSVKDLVMTEYKDNIVHYMRRFPLLSVREKSVAEFVSKQFSVKCDSVLDPVFLLTREEWQVFKNQNEEDRLKNEKYMVIYLLDRENRSEKVNYAIKLALNLNLKIYMLPIFLEDISMGGG